jgi:S1-C subfamily serine protease
MDATRTTAPDIYAKAYRAVVNVHSQITLTTSVFPVVPPNLAGVTSYFLHGNGFIGPGGYIIVPAHLVLIPPTLLLGANRYPYTSPSITAPTGAIPNALTQVSRILVDVFSGKESKTAYSYEARLIGVDGAGDIAVLAIDSNSAYNHGNPCLDAECLALKWGDSKQACTGSQVFGIGDIAGNARDIRATAMFNGITEGVLVRHRQIDFLGVAQQEFLAVDFQASAISSGIPVLNQHGHVLGMTTWSTAEVEETCSPTFPVGQGLVAAISQRFLQPVVEALINTDQRHSDHLEVVDDALGPYNVYQKLYLGIAWQAVTGNTYDTAIDFITGDSSIIYDASGDPVVPPGEKKIIGVQVLALAGGNPANYISVPGAVPIYPFPALPSSPLIGASGTSYVNPGDIITRLGEGDLTGPFNIHGHPTSFKWFALGSNHGQVAPAVVTWFSPVNSTLAIEFRKASELYATAYQTTVLASLLPFYPPALDYPWYAISILAGQALPYPGFQPPF